MKIIDITINNWNPPGDKWWKEVRDRPTEPLIDATITAMLSWAEYKQLLDMDEALK